MSRHGLRYTKEYAIWSGMMTRCYNPNRRNFRWYGAKGVVVCDRWHTFENFYADMGAAPEGLTLDRIDPNGNYEPSNCRWATDAEQAINRTTQKLYEYEGKEWTLPALCREKGVNYRTIRNRLFRTGMTLTEAMNHKLKSLSAEGRNRLVAAVVESNKRRGAV